MNAPGEWLDGGAGHPAAGGSAPSARRGTACSAANARTTVATTPTVAAFLRPCVPLRWGGVPSLAVPPAGSESASGQVSSLFSMDIRLLSRLATGDSWTAVCGSDARAGGKVPDDLQHE